MTVLPLVACLIAAPTARAQSLPPSTLGISVQLHGAAGTMNTAIYPRASGSTALGFGGDVSYVASPRLSFVGRLARVTSKSEIPTESTD